jgi:hypothetical protein
MVVIGKAFEKSMKNLAVKMHRRLLCSRAWARQKRSLRATAREVIARARLGRLKRRPC